MMPVIEKLAVAGCDVHGAIERFLGDEDMYAQFIDAALNEPSFEKLGDAISGGDTKSAFECAHMLKGLLGNMGFTPLYSIDQELTEILRKGSLDGAAELYIKLLEQKQILLDCVVKA